MPRILYLTIQMDLMGGVARIVSEKANWLACHGYDVTVCDIENYPMRPYYPLDPSVKFRLGGIATTPGGMITRLKGVLRMVSQLRRILDEERPDVVINAHCPLVTWVLPMMKYLARGTERKHPSMIMEIHQSRQGLDVFNQRFMSPMGRWVHSWAIRWIYGCYDRFVVLTNGDREQWRLRNCVVIPNFIKISSVSTDNTSSKSALSQPKRQILLLARLMPQKRIDLMIRIWSRLAPDFPDWQVKVLGDGRERENLEQQVRDAGLASSFLLPGQVKDVRPELACSDIFCLTSEYEGFGIVLIEAMLARVPVMAFEYVGVHDIIDDGQSGYIIPFGDVDAYAARLRQLMTSADERNRLVTNAQVAVLKFEQDNVMQQWKELIG